MQNVETWYYALAIVTAIIGSAYYLGTRVAEIQFQIKLMRIDLALLFTHLGLVQPSTAMDPDIWQRNVKPLLPKR